jgi:sugar O-acyltransferase (sialic acid O-acetyltransferase NeuD family)
MALYGLVGAGGFAREVMPMLDAMLRASAQPSCEAVFVIEDQYPLPEGPVNGHRVLHLSEFLRADADRFFNVAIADSKVRQRIVESMPAEVRPVSIVSSAFLCQDAVTIGDGAIFCGFTQVTSNARIGKFFHCNMNSYVAHDAVIGDYVTFAPGVKCNGYVVVEDHAYVGTGVVIRDGTNRPITIGRGAVVGMGAVVTRSVPPGATVVGNPARER